MHIKQAAAALQVSVQTIRNYLEELREDPRDADDRIAITGEMLERLRVLKVDRKARSRGAPLRPKKPEAPPVEIIGEWWACPEGHIWAYQDLGPPFRIERYACPQHPERKLRRFPNLTIGPICWFCLDDTGEIVKMEKGTPEPESPPTP